MSAEKINLVCDGLDTFASVQINGEEILVADNMFVRFVVDVTSKLRVAVFRCCD